MNIENQPVLRLKGFVRKKCRLLIAAAGRFYARNLGFRDVREYLAGQVKSERESSSLILLSTNRSATQFVESVLAKIYSEQGGVYIPLNRYLFFADDDAEKNVLDSHHMHGLMKDEGFFFGQQGPFHQLDLFGNYQKVCVIRDPRDLIVSNYHSIASAHAPRDKAFIEKIHRVQALGLQKFAKEEEFLKPIDSALEQARKMREQDRVLFWRYEDIMDDFEKFEESCQRFINGAVNRKLSEEVRALHLGSVGGGVEVEGRHRRSGQWGQFKKSLDPDIVEWLNQRFSLYLKEFGYHVD